MEHMYTFTREDGSGVSFDVMQYHARGAYTIVNIYAFDSDGNEKDVTVADVDFAREQFYGQAPPESWGH